MITADTAAQSAIDRHLDREEQESADDLSAIEWAAEDALEARRDADRDEAGWDR